MGKRSKQAPKAVQQFAALPVVERDGEVYVLLITSRETGRWILPKGWPEKGSSGAEVAALEAWEEAGVALGSVDPEPLGSYRYVKRLSRSRSVESRVEVYRIAVERLAEDWPEKGQRLREWFTLPQAAMVVDDGELVTLLLTLAAPA